MAKPHLLNTDKHGAVFGFAGWSGSGKTTLVEQVVSHLVGLDYDVATVKHAHHHSDADTPGKDSFRHRQAGARQVLVSSAQRSALFSEHAASVEPDLPQLLLPVKVVIKFPVVVLSALCVIAPDISSVPFICSLPLIYTLLPIC